MYGVLRSPVEPITSTGTSVVMLVGTCGVGVVTPVAVAQRREQGALRALVEVFAANDHPGSCWPTRQINEVGDLGDMGTLRAVTGATSRWQPTALVVSDPADPLVDAGVRAGHHGEPDVAGTAPGREPCRAPGRVGADLHRPPDLVGVVTGVVAGGDLNRNWATASSSTVK